MLTKFFDIYKMKWNIYEANTDPEKHIDTPLSIKHEKIILEKIGFKNVSFIDINSEKYKLLVFNK